MIDRQDVFFDVHSDKHWQNSCTVLAVRRKNSDSQAGEKDNLVKIIPENQMLN